MNRIINDADRASNVIRRIRDLAKNATPEMARLDINEVIEDAIPLVQRQALSHRVTLQSDLAAVFPEVLGDRVQLQQVIINLLMNGLEAMAPVTGRSGELIVRSQPCAGDLVLVAVQDAGVGIARKWRTNSSTLSTRPSRMAWAWACRSAARSSRHARGEYGPPITTGPA